MKFSWQFSQQLPIADAWHFNTLSFGIPYGGIHFFQESDVNFLFVCYSLSKVYNKFSSQFPQQPLSSGAWNFSTHSSLPCHMVGFIFAWIWCQLPVCPSICPYIKHINIYVRAGVLLVSIGSQISCFNCKAYTLLYFCC